MTRLATPATRTVRSVSLFTGSPCSSAAARSGRLGERPVARRDLLAGRRRPGRRAVPERPPAEGLAAVRGQPAGQVRARGHDAARVDAAVHLVVVPLDVVEV